MNKLFRLGRGPCIVSDRDSITCLDCRTSPIFCIIGIGSDWVQINWPKILPPNLNNNWMTAARVVIGRSRYVIGWTTPRLVGIRIQDLDRTIIMVGLWYYSVVILALNPRKSGQIANKGFMIYYGRYRSQVAILKSSKQNSCSNLLNWRIVIRQGYIMW